MNSNAIILRRFIIALCAISSGSVHLSAQESKSDPHSLGFKLYVEHCARCHGANGEGVREKYEETLYGDKTIAELTKIIVETMPEEDPSQVVGDDAKAVAEYISETFYTVEARIRNRPPRIELVRLTNTQYENVTTDLIANFLGRGEVGEERGLKADYYNARNFDRKERKIERTDATVDFDFNEGSPGEGIKSKEFSIQWEGSILAPETGDYEFCVKSENGFRLWVNNQDSALIDGWVSSGSDPREQTGKLKLLGGRSYPIRLDYFKFKDKTASIELRWTPPGGVDEVIPVRHLIPKRVPESFVVTTPFPPDDASFGYERGTSVSKAWNQATTQASVEMANFVVNRLNRLAGTKSDAGDRKDKVRAFSARFVEAAFRRPLTDEQKQLFIEAQFAATDDLEDAVKRIVILTLHSPHFLYPEFHDGQVDSYDVASRLSFGMWDSLPDQPLLQAAAKNELLKPDAVRRQAERMLTDDRARFKMREFFHELLPFQKAAELSKDTDLFPMFDKQFVADLKTSLDMFIEHVVWSESSNYRELLLSSDVYLNNRLAQYYDADIQQNDGFERVTFDSSQRAGVVTHPFLLSALAYHQASSPIHRGVFITRNILSRSLKPPPAAIEFKDSTFDPTMTMREKVTELTKADSCMTCHSIINPLGFSLENYDAIGRFRTTEKDRPIDPTGQLVAGDDETVTFTGARDVAEYAANNPIAQQGFIEQLFQHEIKQPVRAYNDNALEELRTKFEQSGFNMQKLLIEINIMAALHGVDPQQGQ